MDSYPNEVYELRQKYKDVCELAEFLQNELDKARQDYKEMLDTFIHGVKYESVTTSD